MSLFHSTIFLQLVFALLKIEFISSKIKLTICQIYNNIKFFFKFHISPQKNIQVNPKFFPACIPRGMIVGSIYLKNTRKRPLFIPCVKRVYLPLASHPQSLEIWLPIYEVCFKTKWKWGGQGKIMLRRLPFPQTVYMSTREWLIS